MLIAADRRLLGWTLHSQYNGSFSLILRKHSKSTLDTKVTTLDTAQNTEQRRMLQIFYSFCKYRQPGLTRSKTWSMRMSCCLTGSKIWRLWHQWEVFSLTRSFWLRIQDRQLAAFFSSFVRNSQEAKETKKPFNDTFVPSYWWSKSHLGQQWTEVIFFFSLIFFLVRGLGNKDVTHGPVLIGDANA